MKKLVYLVVLKPSSHRTAEESLGVQYLASVLNAKGYNAQIRDAWLNDKTTFDDIYNEIVSKKDEVLFVGTSSYMLNNNITCTLIKKLNKFNINVACGGYGPTFEPEMFLHSGANFVMFGEGEKTILDVCEYFNGLRTLKELKGVVYLKDNQIIKTPANQIVKDLNLLPYPQRPFLDIVKNRHSTINVLSSRGCMGCCTFCSISAFLGEQKNVKWRGRTIDNIIPELVYLQKQGARTIKFVDDSFIEKERDDSWCKAFYEKVKENNIKLQFRASIRADKVTDENMKYLKKAGFFSFSCGIENGSKSALARMAKLASIEDNERALDIFKKYNIYVQGGYILFDNKTTLCELKENYHFLKKYNWLVSKGIFSEMYAAVGTKFTNEIKSDGDETFASNTLYNIEDVQSRMVHHYMKKWQAHHSVIYDMVIDPISAPKDISVDEMAKYYNLMIEMKNIDLDFMRDIINAVENKKDCEQIYLLYNEKYKQTFENIKIKCKNYYELDGLFYDVGENKFLHSTQKETNI